jgi:hypothetical protein
MMRSFGMSLTSRQRMSANHTGPSSQRKPSASFSNGAFGKTKRRKRRSMISKSSISRRLFVLAMS